MIVKALLLALCLVQGTLAEISLNLQETPVVDVGDAIKEFLLTTSITMGEGDHLTTVQAVPDNSVYETYIFESSVCQSSASPSNCWIPEQKYPMYQCQATCVKKTPESNLIKNVEALNNKGVLTLQEGKDTLAIGNHAISRMKLYFAQEIGAAKQTMYFQEGARAGLGFGMGNENLLSILKSNHIISKEGFSTWLYQDQMKLYLGTEQKYFAAEKLSVYNELTTTRKFPLVSSPWTIKLDKVMLFNSMVIIDPTANPPPSLTLSTTTGFLNFPVQHYQEFFDKLKDVNLVQCDDYSANLGLDYLSQKPITCDCSNMNKFPDISFYLTDNSQEGQQQKYTVKPKHYLYDLKQKDGKCIVLVKMIPSTGGAKGENWVLGTPFLKSVYAYFDNQRRTVHMSNLYQFTMEPKDINASANATLIVLGMIIFLVAISALALLLKKLSVVQVMQQQVFQPSRTLQPIVQVQQQPAMQFL